MRSGVAVVGADTRHGDVTMPARVGLIGCGMISTDYLEHAPTFDSFKIVACADLEPERARAVADRYGLSVATIGSLLQDPSIDVVLNLTPPAAHADVLRRAVEAGKHVYTEKPLSATVAEAVPVLLEAERRGLRIGCAPDMFLGATYQAARTLIDQGAIGRPLSVVAAFLTGGLESWHPNVDFFFGKGGGPLLDMGPYYLTAVVALLGRVNRVSGFASTPVAERVYKIGPRAGERFRVTVPTHVAAAFELESGVTGTFVTSFEARDQYLSDLVIYGTEGALALPDPSEFGGAIRIKRAGSDWSEQNVASSGQSEARGLGLHEMILAMAAARPHRASGRLALHVLDVAETIVNSATKGRTLEVLTPCDRPPPYPATRRVVTS